MSEINRKRGTIQSLIAGMQKTDIGTYQAIMLMAADIEALLQLVDPETQTISATVTEEDPEGATSFSYTLQARAIKFTWSSDDDLVRFYELRLGSDWDTAEFITRTPSTVAYIEPVFGGPHTYLLKTINSTGGYSETALELIVTIPAMGSITVHAQVIDNNVLLSWNEPTSSFEVSHYEIFRDGVEIGEQRGTFATIFEPAGGTYEYSIIAYDLAGNASAEAFISVAVNQPPDYELEADHEVDMTAPTSSSNIYAENANSALIPADDTETWEDHFINNTYTSPQDQIDDGYPLYLQPTPASGEITEVWNLGASVERRIVKVTWTEEPIAGAVTVAVQLSHSTDGIAWTACAPGTIAFIDVAFQYIKLEFEVTPTSGTGFSRFSGLTLSIDVKQETDSGNVSALAADASGTTVTFNKAFKDVKSITVSALGTVERKAIYDFVDIPDPVSFKVLVYNAAGARVDATVSWKARGVV